MSGIPMVDELIKRIERIEDRLSNGLSKSVAGLEVSHAHMSATMDDIKQSVDKLYEARFSENKEKYDNLSSKVFTVSLAIAGGFLGLLSFIWTVYKTIGG